MPAQPGFHSLMYHEIVPAEDIPAVGRTIDVRQRYADLLPASLFVEADAFRHQMEYLANRGYTTITLSEIKAFYAAGTIPPERAVLLTFDDLYQSVREYAYPVLRDLGFRATGFVVREWVFEEPRPRTTELSRTLSWPELDEMGDVFEYANHSSALHTREEHGTAVERAPRDLLIADTSKAGEGLTHPDVYAYPFGIFTDQTSDWLAEAGITLAFTTRPGYNTVRTPRLELNRTAVVSDITIEEFAELLAHDEEG